jgi:type II secretory pathway predicted ATPase ExeA
LAIVLVGQPELKAMLDESRNWEAREVIRRIEVVELDPLQNSTEIQGYLDVKFERLGLDRSAIITTDGCDALAAKLSRRVKDGPVYTVAYPLLVNNWTARALNLAAEIGADIVDAEVVGSL